MSTTTQNPTVVFVPGSFHTPAHYEPIGSLLEKHGFPSLAVQLPTIGATARKSDQHDDLQAIRDQLKRLIDEEQKEVLLVMHSSGGVVGCQTVHGFEKSARIAQGKSGGIIGCLFLSAVLLLEGETVRSFLEGPTPPSTAVEDGLLRATNGPDFYSDMSEAEAEIWCQKLEVQARTDPLPVESPCWDLDVPITCVICTKDQVMPPELQNKLIDRVKRDHWIIERVEADHSLYLSQPNKLVNIIQKISGVAETSGV